LFKAPFAVVAPVPPFAMAIVVPFHVPVEIVPRVVVDVLPVYVSAATSSKTEL